MEPLPSAVLAWDPKYSPGAHRDRKGCLGGNRRVSLDLGQQVGK